MTDLRRKVELMSGYGSTDDGRDLVSRSAVLMLIDAVPVEGAECGACGHASPHNVAGYQGCVANVMEGTENLQCCCDGQSGPVIRRHGTEPLGEIVRRIQPVPVEGDRERLIVYLASIAESGAPFTNDDVQMVADALTGVSLTGSGLDVERLKRVLRRLLENEDNEVFAILHAEAADEFAADIAELYATGMPE